ncbi:hypothetical protein CC78DRAFT_580002 [Lojkania enalia]|uniref:Uncharacterized protein n=1 Tax=Lojkania enalia TaxID=147567 RepID=A0A9P4N3T0_9PLEO|nr:hypothetical protein CC78DRAFT_580002 [Didymosphaeria enalia]
MRIVYNLSALLLLPALAASQTLQTAPQPANSASPSLPSLTSTAPLSNLPPQTPTPAPIVSGHPNLRGIQDPAPANQQTSTHPQPSESVTVQWLETTINKIRTWVPVTVTVTFAAVPDQAPQPGKGEIGMGTLTGVTGRTRTVVLGAAPSMGWSWGRVVAVGMGVGVALV